MDDFIPQTLNESLNEWCARLVNVLTPRIVENLWILLEEARKTSADAKQLDKYLLSFQQLLQFVPKWSSTQVEEIRKQMIKKSGCNYLEELVTCAHIILTKALVCARPGNRQKQLNVSIPKLDVFLHKVFIKSAGHAYRNAYLFEKEVAKLQYQKNMHDLERLIQRAILDTVRENVPEEEIIRAFLDENYEYEEEVTIEPIPDDTKDEKSGHENNAGENLEKTTDAETEKIAETEDEKVPYIQDVSEGPVITQLEFNEEVKGFQPFDANPLKPNVLSNTEPKTLQQLAEKSAAAGFLKDQEVASEKMALASATTDIQLDDFIEVLDAYDSSAKPSNAKEENIDSLDFMLDIEDIA